MAKEYVLSDTQIRSDAMWKAIELVKATMPPGQHSSAAVADAAVEVAIKFHKFMSEGK